MTESESGFYVTLTSNSSLTYFPTNNAASFTAQLINPIQLNSSEWEVGLKEITFPSTWKNVKDGSNTLEYSLRLLTPRYPAQFVNDHNKVPDNQKYKLTSEEITFKNDVSIYLEFTGNPRNETSKMCEMHITR